jgi:putative resolvase
MKISIRKAAESLGVSVDTLRRWEKEGKIKSERTQGGHRRYDLSSLSFVGAVPKKLISSQLQRPTLVYARVSSRDQKEDLSRQIQRLETYCAAQGWTYEVLSDLGSGLNYQKKGIKQLIQKICTGSIGRLVLTHKDRLLRFGSELIFSLCEQYGIEVILLNSSEERSFEEELAQDVLEIIAVFSARLYGARSHKNKKILETLKEAARESCS